MFKTRNNARACSVEELSECSQQRAAVDYSHQHGGAAPMHVLAGLVKKKQQSRGGMKRTISVAFYIRSDAGACHVKARCEMGHVNGRGAGQRRA
jgi:hypothetical protein